MVCHQFCPTVGILHPRKITIDPVGEREFPAGRDGVARQTGDDMAVIVQPAKNVRADEAACTKNQYLHASI